MMENEKTFDFSILDAMRQTLDLPKRVNIDQLKALHPKVMKMYLDFQYLTQCVKYSKMPRKTKEIHIIENLCHE